MNSKIIGLVTLCFALALPVLGQGPRGRRDGSGPSAGVTDGERTRQGERNPLGRLQEALDLTPSQVASLESLFEQRQAAQQGFQGQLRASREALRAARESGDPTAIGNAVLAQEELQDQLRQISEEFMTQFRNLLTLNQQEILDGIEAFGGGTFDRGSGSRGGRGSVPRARQGQ